MNYEKVEDLTLAIFMSLVANALYTIITKTIKENLMLGQMKGFS